MQSEHVHFGVFDFDIATRQLRRDGVHVPLQTQPAQVLGCLLQSAGEVVTRDDLRQAVWGGETFVDYDRGLNFCISQIRTALHDDSTQPVYIRTIPKLGYQFIAPVERIPDRPQEAQAPMMSATSGFGVRKTVFALAIGLMALLVLAVGFSFRPGRSAKPIPIVAVLRFDNETGNPDLLRFSDGLTDNTVEQLTSLSRGRYSVIGNAQILRRPRDERDLKAIAASLHASYVVLGQVQANNVQAGNVQSGNVQVNNGQVRILAHLIHLPDQTHIWVARMDRTLVDPLNIESDAAQRIANDFSGRVAANLVKWTPSLLPASH